jgi:hypothetical protein
MTNRKAGICRTAEIIAIAVGILSAGLNLLQAANGVAVAQMSTGAVGPMSLLLLAVVSPAICGFIVGLMTAILYKKGSYILPVLFAVGLVGWSLVTRSLRVRMIEVYSEHQTEISPDLSFMVTMFVSAIVGAVLGQLVGQLMMRNCLDSSQTIKELE